MLVGATLVVVEDWDVSTRYGCGCGVMPGCSTLSVEGRGRAAGDGGDREDSGGERRFDVMTAGRYHRAHGSHKARNRLL